MSVAFAREESAETGRRGPPSRSPALATPQFRDALWIESVEDSDGGSSFELRGRAADRGRY